MAAGSSGSLWLAQDPSKRWAEVFFLVYSVFWILWALCILVPLELYEVNKARFCQRPQADTTGDADASLAPPAAVLRRAGVPADRPVRRGALRRAAHHPS